MVMIMIHDNDKVEIMKGNEQDKVITDKNVVSQKEQIIQETNLN